jgi:preprotein translocase subunit SecA
MKARIDEEVVRYLWHLRPVVQAEGQAALPATPAPRRQAALNYSAPSDQPSPVFAGAAAGVAAGAPRQPARVGGDDAPIRTVRREEPKIGRNDPCWCGSGKKFKKCHGA